MKSHVELTGLYSAFALLSLLLLAGCGGEETDTATSLTEDGEGIRVTDSWARPAAEGMNSAAYLTIRNFESLPDTLRGVSADIAGMVQVHESYDAGDGMAGMRGAGALVIPAGSALLFEPGGLHVMLMQLNRPFAENDQFELTLTFENGGDVTVTVPVELR